MDYKGTDIYLSFFPLYVSGCIFIGILWATLIYKMLTYQHSEVQYGFVYHFYRITALICFSSCLGCAIVDTLHLLLSWKNDYYMLGNKLSNVKAAADFFFFTASAFLNIILAGRVHFTFKHSFFALSKCTLFCIIFQIISSVCLGVAYGLLVIIYGNINESVADSYVGPLVIAIVCNDLSVSISMMYLFSYKLKQVIILNNINTNNSHNKKEQYRRFKEISEHTYTRSKLSVLSLETQQSANPSGLNLQESLTRTSVHKIELDSNQLDTLVVVTRHTVLSAFAIFFNQLYYAFNYVSMRDTWENSYIDGLLVYELRIIGMLGMQISLYFSMTFAKDAYFKYCACCHLSCYSCCVQCTQRSIKKQITQKHITK